MRRPRISTRGLMAVVLGVGLALGLGWPAAEVARTKESHVHGWIEVGASDTLPLLEQIPFHERQVASPFWPRYQLRLMGRSWRHLPACLVGKTRPGEACSIEDQDSFTSCILYPLPFYSPTIAMFRKVRAMYGLPPDPRMEVILGR